MIGRLTGKILEKKPPFLLLDVNGVGYELEASMNTLYKLPEAHDAVTLHTHLIVREDAHILYGFFDLTERSLFRLLLKANGVGPKLALTILSSVEPAYFVQCVNNQDTSTLVKIPGVGKKTAERLIIEMRDRLAGWLEKGGMQLDISCGNKLMTEPTASEAANSNFADALSGLVTLGYSLTEAQRALSNIEDKSRNSAELIREALRNLTK